MHKSFRSSRVSPFISQKGEIAKSPNPIYKCCVTANGIRFAQLGDQQECLREKAIKQGVQAICCKQLQE